MTKRIVPEASPYNNANIFDWNTVGDIFVYFAVGPLQLIPCIPLYFFAVATGGGAAFVSAANVVAEVVANVVAAAVVVDVASLESRATTSKTDVSSKSTKKLPTIEHFRKHTLFYINSLGGIINILDLRWFCIRLHRYVFEE